MTSDTNDNRRPTWMLLEVVVGEKMTKTNSKKQNSKSQVETSSLKLITKSSTKTRSLSG